jgi:dTDP-4-amino-4,6-dideoxygalactose transaminase
MQFIDLAAQQARIKSQINARIQTVLAHGNYIMGPEVKELEGKLAAYAGTKHAIGCASGTDALLLALMAYGVGPGDAIFTTPFTFIATAEVISLLGATPIFVDIGAEYKGRKACSLADIACTSFFPAKPLGCYGDGGIPIASSASPCIRI